ncbi:MAG: DUF3999 family protein, partial [Bacteroidetes bacterium]
MKRMHLFLLVLGLCPVWSWGQVDGYAYRRMLTGLRTTGYHRLVLPPAVLSQLRPGLEDVRLVRLPVGDSLPMQEIPYLIRSLAPEAGREACPVRLLRQGSNQEGTVVVLRRLDDQPADLIEVDLAERTYDLRARLEGSDNRLTWKTLGEDFRLIGLATDQMTYRYHRIALPVHRHRFLRIQLDGEVRVEDVNLWAQAPEEGERQPFDLQDWQVRNNTETKVTEVDVTLKASYPLDQLRLQIGTERDFFRPITVNYLKQVVETDQGQREIWREWTQGILSSLEEPVLTGPVVHTDRLQLRIQNFDDLPLEVQAVSLSGPVYELVADLEATASYALYYGNPAATAPRYDLVYFRDRLPDTPLPVSLSEEEVLGEAGEPESEPAEEDSRLT